MIQMILKKQCFGGMIKYISTHIDKPDIDNLVLLDRLTYFSMRVGAYADEKTRVEKFVDKCESLMLEETSEWRTYIERAKEMGK